MMLVRSLWDQEDIYGAMAVYKAIKPKDNDNDKVFLVLGPWYHGQEIEDGSSLGAMRFGSDTGLWFRQHVLAPVPGALSEGRCAADRRRAGHGLRNRREPVAAALPLAWPVAPSSARQADATLPARLQARALLAPQRQRTQLTRRLRRIRLRSRPSRCRSARGRTSPSATSRRTTWAHWLVDDQREASGRTDVLTYTTDVLTAPVQISGQPVVNLVASTSGTDSDWVVKLIDVYPDEVAGQPQLGGYQLAVAMDIFRGPLSRELHDPKPIEPNKPLTYRFELPAGQPRLPARPPHHGAGAVELVPALRPQPADIRAEHLLRQAGGLPEGDAAHLPRAGQGELHRLTARRGKVEEK